MFDHLRDPRVLIICLVVVGAAATFALRIAYLKHLKKDQIESETWKFLNQESSDDYNFESFHFLATQTETFQTETQTENSDENFDETMKNLSVLSIAKMKNQGETEIALAIFVNFTCSKEITEDFKQDLDIVIEDFWEVRYSVQIDVNAVEIAGFEAGTQIFLMETLTDDMELLKRNFDGNEELFEEISEHLRKA